MAQVLGQRAPGEREGDLGDTRAQVDTWVCRARDTAGAVAECEMRGIGVE